MRDVEKLPEPELVTIHEEAEKMEDEYKKE